MREIQAGEIRDAVRSLILEASYVIGDDVRAKIAACLETEPSPSGCAVLD